MRITTADLLRRLAKSAAPLPVCECAGAALIDAVDNGWTRILVNEAAAPYGVELTNAGIEALASAPRRTRFIAAAGGAIRDKQGES